LAWNCWRCFQLGCSGILASLLGSLFLSLDHILIPVKAACSICWVCLFFSTSPYPSLLCLLLLTFARVVGDSLVGLSSYLV
jgi:hypothetical protein